MNVHFIAIGGAVMHDLALALNAEGIHVTGSDDHIFEPSKSRLADAGILPVEMGWFPEKIHASLDAVVLGMHARADNPELLKATQLGLRVLSYPEYIYSRAIPKKRVVIGGSHGKTTITAMILHVLQHMDFDFDYVVGAQLPGFSNRVKLSDAPLIVIEGDEYLASAIDRRPKFHFYHPHIAVISGIAWDHMNVFPTFQIYKEQFSKFINTIEPHGKLIYCAEDPELEFLIEERNNLPETESYSTPDYRIQDGKTDVIYDEKYYPLQIFGHHNLLNLQAAGKVCKHLGIDLHTFYEAISTFKGAARRLEVLASDKATTIFKDFAHAPSKLKATIHAVKEQFPKMKLIACIELHTFSSLNKDFLPLYAHSMAEADEAIVFIDQETFRQKNMPPYNADDIRNAFADKNLKFFNQPEKIKSYLLTLNLVNTNLILMSSGNFGGIDLVTLSKMLLNA